MFFTDLVSIVLPVSSAANLDTESCFDYNEVHV